MTSTQPMTHLLWIILFAGVGLFLVGLVIVNRAVLRMADAVNERFGQRNWRWWNALGARSSEVVREYGVGPETKLLQKGYVLGAIGFALMCTPSVIRKFTE